jgi:Flp pilus assembly pilin Flp
MVRLLRRFRADQTAATWIEYSLIAAGIALAIVANEAQGVQAPCGIIGKQ